MWTLEHFKHSELGSWIRGTIVLLEMIGLVPSPNLINFSKMLFYFIFVKLIIYLYLKTSVMLDQTSCFIMYVTKSLHFIKIALQLLYHNIS